MLLKLSEDGCGLVAQLDRVFDYESKGRGFESRRAHQENAPEALKNKAPGLFFIFCDDVTIGKKFYHVLENFNLLIPLLIPFFPLKFKNLQ